LLKSFTRDFGYTFPGNAVFSFIIIFFANRLEYETLDSDLKTHRKHKNFTENLLWIFQVKKMLTFL